MLEFFQSVMQGLWSADGWAQQLTPSLMLLTFLILSQVAAVILISSQIKALPGREALMGSALVLAFCLLALTITKFDAGWLLLLIPVTLGMLAGYCSKGWVRWSARILFVGSALAALILGSVALAAIICCSLISWLIGFIASRSQV